MSPKPKNTQRERSTHERKSQAHHGMFPRAAPCSDVPARRRRFPPAHPLVLAHAVSHFASPCPALCVLPVAENTLMAEPQAVPASGEAAPLPSLESALDAALRERCTAACFPDLFIPRRCELQRREGVAFAHSCRLAACTHSGPGASAATLPPLGWLLSITVRFSQVPAG